MYSSQINSFCRKSCLLHSKSCTRGHPYNVLNWMLSQIDSQFSKWGNDQWLHIGSCDAANNYETVDDGAALEIRQRKHPAGKNVLRKGGGETSGWVLSDSTSTWTGKAISESSAQITREPGGFKLFCSPNLSWTPLFTEGRRGGWGERKL